MPEIPTYEVWIKETHSAVYRRSESLQLLDEAIRARNREAIKTAFELWKSAQKKKGNDWRKSVRNSRNACTKLDRALNPIDGRRLSQADLDGFAVISQAQSDALKKLFEGKEVSFRPSTLAAVKRDISGLYHRFKGDASKVWKKQPKNLEVQNQAVQFAAALCPGLEAEQVFHDVGLVSVSSFAADVAPIAGMLSSGGQALGGWITLAKRYWDSMTTANARCAFRIGQEKDHPSDPEAALDALLKVIERDIKALKYEACVRSMSFTAKTLGACADAGALTGPMVGVLETFARCMWSLEAHVCDDLECKAANRLLKAGNLDLHLFEACPLLGCYFLVIQDHSTIINFAVSDYGIPNWVFDVQNMMTKVQPVLDKARGYIKSSNLEVPGLEDMKGIVEANWSHRGAIEKVATAKEAVCEKIVDALEHVAGKPRPVRPHVEPWRMVGFGSDQYEQERWHPPLAWQGRPR